MKKIIIGGSLIAAVAVVAIGATTAFFNDTETSSGNVFIAGSIDITVDSNGSSYNGDDLSGSNFPARNLTDEHFFTFDDVKPGDYGIRHISLHVADNDSYACLLIHNKDDDDNGITDPEDEVDNIDDGLDGTADGDLSKDLELFAWEDLNNNQVYDPVSNNEKPLVSNGDWAVDSFFDITYEVIFDSNSTMTSKMVPNVTRNITLAWCAGTQTVNHSTGEISCDGSGMGDISQSDTFVADVTLYGEQIRNNPDFDCANVTL